ncbi:MAG: hypothetical protein ACOX5R_07715 [bacterium]
MEACIPSAVPEVVVLSPGRHPVVQSWAEFRECHSCSLTVRGWETPRWKDCANPFLKRSNCGLNRKFTSG